MIRGAPATGPPLFLSPEKEGEANMHEYFMYPEMDAAKPHDHFMSPCRGVLHTPHKRPGTGRIRAKPHECFTYPGTDNAKPHGSRIHLKMDNVNTRHSFSAENVCGAYAIRPYTDAKTIRAEWRRSFSFENVRRAYAIRPYTGTKMVRAGAHIPDSFHYPTFAL